MALCVTLFSKDAFPLRSWAAPGAGHGGFYASRLLNRKGLSLLLDLVEPLFEFAQRTLQDLPDDF